MTESATWEKVLHVVRQIVRVIDIRSRRLIQDYGLTGPQLMVLRAIAYQGKVSTGDLADQVNLSHSTVTGILDRLEKRGLIIRTRSDPEDRRIVLVNLEQAGLNVLATAPPMMHEQFIEKFSKLEPWEQTLILSTIQRLATMMSIQDTAVTTVERPLESEPIAPETLDAIAVMNVAPAPLPTVEPPLETGITPDITGGP